MKFGANTDACGDSHKLDKHNWKLKSKHGRCTLTEAEADAILKKYAPNWVEHLRDMEVVRRIMFYAKGGINFK